jgi:hypothetical protein
MPEAVFSGGANIGPTNMHVGPAFAEMSAAEVTSTKVTPINVSSTKRYRPIFPSRDPSMLDDDELRPVE